MEEIIQSSAVVVRELQINDRPAWLRMRKQLWPDSDEADAFTWLSNSDAVTLVAFESAQEDPIGLAEVGMRPYADGCDTSPVAFLEGWFVKGAYRRRGVGTALIKAVTLWARDRGCSEFASDALLENTAAHLAHISVGFQEVERCIKYRRKLDSARALRSQF